VLERRIEAQLQVDRAQKIDARSRGQRCRAPLERALGLGAILLISLLDELPIRPGKIEGFFSGLGNVVHLSNDG